MHTSLDPEARARRAQRFRTLEYVRGVTHRRGGKRCMFTRKGVAETYASATGSGVVHLSNVQRCASPWSCPVCAPTIGERRADEIDRALSHWLDAGNSALFVTATLSHKLGDDLDSLLELVQRSWSRTFRWPARYVSRVSGEVTNADRCRPDWYEGQVRTVEVTYGKNGWHPHVHAIVFVRGGDSQPYGYLRDLRKRWGESVDRYGGSTDVVSNSSPGWDVRRVTSSEVSGYLTKVEGAWSAGRELARADSKSHGMTPAHLLEAASAGCARSGKLFKVYEIATTNRQRIVASPGLLSMVSDDEAAEAVLEDELAVSVAVPARSWRRLLRSGRAAAFLDDVARLGMGEVFVWPYPPAWRIIRLA